MKRLIPFIFLAATDVVEADTCLSDPNHYSAQAKQADLLPTLEASEGEAKQFSIENGELGFMCGDVHTQIEINLGPDLVQQLSPITERATWEVRNDISFKTGLQDFAEFAKSVQQQCKQLTQENEK